MKRLAALAVMVTAVVMAGCSSSSTSSTTTTSHVAAPTSSTIANSVTGTVKWVANNKAVVTTLSADVAALGTDLPAAVSSHSMSAVTASCPKLATDVATAKALPPIPNSTAQKAWTSLLDDLSSAAQKCTDGISKNDTGELSQAATKVSSSSSSLSSLKQTLGL